MDICNTVFAKLNCSVKKMSLYNCKTEEEIRHLLETIQKALVGSDTCDQNCNTCSDKERKSKRATLWKKLEITILYKTHKACL